MVEKKKGEVAIKGATDEWRDTFDAISDLIFLQDKNYTITRANKSFAAVMKMRPEEIVGMKCYELLHKRNMPWSDCPFEKTMKDGKAHTEEIDDPNIGIPILVTTSPILNDKGEVVGSVHIAKDISEMKNAQKDLELKIRDLERFQKVTMGREARIIELKAEVKRLRGELAEK